MMDSSSLSPSSSSSCLTLSSAQIETYLQDGVLVVPNVLNATEIQEALAGLSATLAHHGVDCRNLQETGHGLQQLSSTNGSGGVLDLFYDSWKLQIATNPRLFHCTSQLWKAAYCYDGGVVYAQLPTTPCCWWGRATGSTLNTRTHYTCYDGGDRIIQSRDDLPLPEQFKWHPYGGNFDPTRGYAFIDRIGYRLPSQLSLQLGKNVRLQQGGMTKKKKHAKKMSLQRSLTPHLDCCPETLYQPTSAARKFRPMQCFVSLTDNLEPNQGGFEACRQFHVEFQHWQRPPTIIHRKDGTTESIPAPCIGEYTHIRPLEDAAVFRRIQHVPVAAGSAVFWDIRIPHANAYHHTGTEPRCVVYCSFLPADVPLNQQYVQQQLQDWKQGRNPTDQWIRSNGTDDEEQNNTSTTTTRLSAEQENSFTPLQRRFFGIDPW